VRAGSTPRVTCPTCCDFSDEVIWPNFRFGSKPGAPYPDSQFPVTAVDELTKQGVPDLSFGGLPTPKPMIKALSDLASKLSGAVLMGHSQSGPFPLAAALLNPTAAKGLLSVRQMGAERIIAMSRHESRQKLDREFGATDILTERGDEGVARVKDLTKGIGADSVLECVGTQESVLKRSSAVINHLVRTELLHKCGIDGRHRCKNMSPVRSGDLNCKQSYCSGSAMNQHTLPGLEPSAH
jgi:hypothetical protein